jgi:hypothetical protein
MQSQRDEVPLVCSIENAEQKQVRGEELAVLFANATGFEELENGYAFSSKVAPNGAPNCSNLFSSKRSAAPFSISS